MHVFRACRFLRTIFDCKAMITRIRHMRLLSTLLLALFLMDIVPCQAIAAPGGGNLENVHFDVSGRIVYIYYDLKGGTDETFTVRVFLRRSGENDYSYVPQNVSGDVGRKVLPGGSRRIVWNLSQEFPDGLKGGDFYFVLEAEVENSGGIGPTLIIAGGVALVGGIVGILLLSKSADQTSSTSSSSFPTPPGRP